MKIIYTITILGIFLFSINCKAQNTSHFKTLEEAEIFFEKFDDDFNKAMVEGDSNWFENNIADNYFNCTPKGDINNKKAEINTLLWLTTLLSKVDRVSPQNKIFTYSGNVATLSVVKKLTHKNSFVTYVRRSNVYQFINGKWKNVSGQGTTVPNENIEEKN